MKGVWGRDVLYTHYIEVVWSKIRRRREKDDNIEAN